MLLPWDVGTVGCVETITVPEADGESSA